MERLVSKKRSIRECAWECQNYKYFGLQARTECWCGNDEESFKQHGKAEEDQCHSGFDENPPEKYAFPFKETQASENCLNAIGSWYDFADRGLNHSCGGDFRMSVYKRGMHPADLGEDCKELEDTVEKCRNVPSIKFGGVEIRKNTQRVLRKNALRDVNLNNDPTPGMDLEGIVHCVGNGEDAKHRIRMRPHGWWDHVGITFLDEDGEIRLRALQCERKNTPGYTPLGCYNAKDSSSGAGLPDTLVLPGNPLPYAPKLSIRECAYECRGNPFFAMLNGGECRCVAEKASYEKLGRVEDPAKCAVECETKARNSNWHLADRSLGAFCGGENANAVFHHGWPEVEVAGCEHYGDADTSEMCRQENEVKFRVSPCNEQPGDLCDTWIHKGSTRFLWLETDLHGMKADEKQELWCGDGVERPRLNPTSNGIGLGASKLPWDRLHIEYTANSEVKFKAYQCYKPEVHRYRLVGCYKRDDKTPIEETLVRGRRSIRECSFECFDPNKGNSNEFALQNGGDCYCGPPGKSSPYTTSSYEKVDDVNLCKSETRPCIGSDNYDREVNNTCGSLQYISVYQKGWPAGDIHMDVLEGTTSAKEDKVEENSQGSSLHKAVLGRCTPLTDATTKEACRSEREVSIGASRDNPDNTNFYLRKGMTRWVTKRHLKSGYDPEKDPWEAKLWCGDDELGPVLDPSLYKDMRHSKQWFDHIKIGYSTDSGKVELTPVQCDPGGYRLLGCYKDNEDDRILLGLQPALSVGPYSLRECAFICKTGNVQQRAFDLFGLQDGNRCFCGVREEHDYTRFGPVSGENACSTECMYIDPYDQSVGNTCGGHLQMSVYEFGWPLQELGSESNECRELTDGATMERCASRLWVAFGNANGKQEGSKRGTIKYARKEMRRTFVKRELGMLENEAGAVLYMGCGTGTGQEGEFHKDGQHNKNDIMRVRMNPGDKAGGLNPANWVHSNVWYDHVIVDYKTGGGKVNFTPLQCDPGGYEYLGCFQDQREDPAMGADHPAVTKPRSVRECAHDCRKYLHFALRNQDECICGGGLKSSAAPAASSSFLDEARSRKKATITHMVAEHDNPALGRVSPGLKSDDVEDKYEEPDVNPPSYARHGPAKRSDCSSPCLASVGDDYDQSVGNMCGATDGDKTVTRISVYKYGWPMAGQDGCLNLLNETQKEGGSTISADETMERCRGEYAVQFGRVDSGADEETKKKERAALPWIRKGMKRTFVKRELGGFTDEGYLFCGNDELRMKMHPEIKGASAGEVAGDMFAVGAAVGATVALGPVLGAAIMYGRQPNPNDWTPSRLWYDHVEINYEEKTGEFRTTPLMCGIEGYELLGCYNFSPGDAKLMETMASSTHQKPLFRKVSPMPTQPRSPRECSHDCRHSGFFFLANGVECYCVDDDRLKSEANLLVPCMPFRGKQLPPTECSLDHCASQEAPGYDSAKGNTCGGKPGKNTVSLYRLGYPKSEATSDGCEKLTDAHTMERCRDQFEIRFQKTYVRKGMTRVLVKRHANVNMHQEGEMQCGEDKMKIRMVPGSDALTSNPLRTSEHVEVNYLAQGGQVHFTPLKCDQGVTPEFIGCYRDSWKYPAMVGRRPVPRRSVRECAHECRDFGYFGLGPGGRCYCSAHLTNEGPGWTAEHEIPIGQAPSRFADESLPKLSELNLQDAAGNRLSVGEMLHVTDPASSPAGTSTAASSFSQTPSSQTSSLLENKQYRQQQGGSDPFHLAPDSSSEGDTTTDATGALNEPVVTATAGEDAPILAGGPEEYDFDKYGRVPDRFCTHPDAVRANCVDSFDGRANYSCGSKEDYGPLPIDVDSLSVLLDHQERVEEFNKEQEEVKRLEEQEVRKAQEVGAGTAATGTTQVGQTSPQVLEEGHSFTQLRARVAARSKFAAAEGDAAVATDKVFKGRTEEMINKNVLDEDDAAIPSPGKPGEGVPEAAKSSSEDEDSTATSTTTCTYDIFAEENEDHLQYISVYKNVHGAPDADCENLGHTAEACRGEDHVDFNWLGLRKGEHRVVAKHTLRFLEKQGGTVTCHNRTEGYTPEHDPSFMFVRIQGVGDYEWVGLDYNWDTKKVNFNALSCPKRKLPPTSPHLDPEGYLGCTKLADTMERCRGDNKITFFSGEASNSQFPAVTVRKGDYKIFARWRLGVLAENGSTDMVGIMKCQGEELTINLDPEGAAQQPASPAMQTWYHVGIDYWHDGGRVNFYALQCVNTVDNTGPPPEFSYSSDVAPFGAPADTENQNSFLYIVCIIIGFIVLLAGVGMWVVYCRQRRNRDLEMVDDGEDGWYLDPQENHALGSYSYHDSSWDEVPFLEPGNSYYETSTYNPFHQSDAQRAQQQAFYNASYGAGGGTTKGKGKMTNPNYYGTASYGGRPGERQIPSDDDTFDFCSIM
ncbi:unnamed protein product [Amoebophrya sp. A120]|nr:unnamed protein product [Amoebophrya sp. A120]|eukprot:GSA120T00011517001.1